MDWLVMSIVASVVLTIVLNVALRAFPGAADRAGRRLDQVATPARQDGRRVQVWFPWRGMLLASLALTIVLNVVIRLL